MDEVYKRSTFRLIKVLTMQISDQMAAELVGEMAMTRRLLEKVPDEKLSWKPAEDLHTIGWNVAHLVETLSWVPGIIAESEFDIAPEGGEPDTVAEANQMQPVLEAFDQSSQAALAALKGVPDSVMAEPWSLKMGGQTLFTLAKGECLRKWVFSHTAHHRGVLSTYLRLAGLQFTSIYEE